VCHKSFEFTDFEACSRFFKGLINLFRQMNYSEWKSDKFYEYKSQIEQVLNNQLSK
jgi:V/A-type H+-transporting ATPase subunit A